MPGNNMADTPELGGKDISDSVLTSPPSKKINPSYVRRAQADSYDEDESDSPSDDESSFSPESEDAVSRKSDGSKSLKQSKITTSLQSMSLGQKTSEGSVESSVSERGDHKAWARSSSKNFYLSTSDDENHSKDESTGEDSSDENSDDDDDRNAMTDIINTFKKFELNINSETSKNDNNKSKLNKNEEDDPSSKDNFRNQFDARGPERSEKIHPDTSPYAKEKPKNVDLGNAVASLLATYPETFNGVFDELKSDESNSAGLSPADLRWDAYPDMNTPMMNGFNGSPTGSPQSSIYQEHTDFSIKFNISATGYPQTISLTVQPPLSSGSSAYLSDNNEQSVSFFYKEPTDLWSAMNIPEPETAQTMSMLVPPPLSSSSSMYLSDSNEQSVSPIPPSLDLDLLDDMININNSSAEFSQLVPSMIQQTVSSDSSLSFSDSNDSGIGLQTTNNILSSDIGHQQRAFATQLCDIPNNIQYTENICTVNPANLNNIPTNVGQNDFVSCAGEQMPTRVEMGLNQMTPDLFSWPTTMLTQNQNNILQNTGNINAVQYNPLATQIQNATRDSSAGGILIVTSNNTDERLNTSFGRNTTDIGIQNKKLDNYSVSQIKNSTSNAHHQINSVLNTRTQTPSASMNIPQIPTTVLERSSQRRRNHPKLIAPWPLLKYSTTPATERLKQNINVKVLQQELVQMYELKLEEYAKQRNGDTLLMAILRDQKRLKAYLVKFVAILDKTARIPESFTLTNDGYDALYLAAINCPELDYVTGSLLTVIARSSVANIIWQRKYGTKGDTLIHAVAAKGESHKSVLRELLTSGKFDLSEQNYEGNTPLHVAVEAHNVGAGINSVATVQMLLKYGANSAIRNNNGDTALHMAMSKTHCQGLVQAVLHTGNGKDSVNIRNNAGNTPLHLAAALLNVAHQGTQEKVCSFLIVNGARIDIVNRQNKTPLGLVAEKRRDVIGKILHKKL